VTARNNPASLAFADAGSIETKTVGAGWAWRGLTMQNQRNGMIETAEEAKGAITETAQRVKDTAADLGARAQHYATEAGRQVSAAAQTAYSTGNDARGGVEGFVRENVWASVLIAGAVGYGLAYLMKNARAD
jgi:ElaB/YqjD/DUF883 family membrane-anchored ribosome-binding protein